MSDNDDIEVDSDEESPRYHSVVRNEGRNVPKPLL